MLQKAYFKNPFISESRILKYLSRHLFEDPSLWKLHLEQIYFRTKIGHGFSTKTKWKHNAKQFRKQYTKMKIKSAVHVSTYMYKNIYASRVVGFLYYFIQFWIYQRCHVNTGQRIQGCWHHFRKCQFWCIFPHVPHAKGSCSNEILKTLLWEWSF